MKNVKVSNLTCNGSMWDAHAIKKHVILTCLWDTYVIKLIYFVANFCPVVCEASMLLFKVWTHNCKMIEISSKPLWRKYPPTLFFFFFFDMSTQEGRGGFELVTSASLDLIPVDWAIFWRPSNSFKIVSSIYKHLKR